MTIQSKFFNYQAQYTKVFLFIGKVIFIGFLYHTPSYSGVILTFPNAHQNNCILTLSDGKINSPKDNEQLSQYGSRIRQQEVKAKVKDLEERRPRDQRELISSAVEKLKLEDYLKMFSSKKVWWKLGRQFLFGERGPNFGLENVLSENGEPKSWASSGVSTNFFTGSFTSNNFQLSSENFPGAKINQILLMGNYSPNAFQEKIFHQRRGNFWSGLEKNIEFQSKGLQKTEMVLLKETVDVEDAWERALPEQIISNIQSLKLSVTYVEKATAAIKNKDHILYEYFNKFDILTDYMGNLTNEESFTSQMYAYNKLLKVNGYLFIALPLSLIGKNGNEHTLFTFSEYQGRTSVEIKAEDFFRGIKGFVVENSYLTEHGLTNDVGTSMNEDLASLIVNNKTEVSLSSRAKYLVLIMRKNLDLDSHQRITETYESNDGITTTNLILSPLSVIFSK